jgi:predicted HicB family RNase H-like nuclease
VVNRKRSKQVTLRVTDEEYDWLVALAEKAGLTLNDWLRQAIRKSSEKLNK